jgi:hypothetical protein
MKLIAHRGLMWGPDKLLENSPDQILLACSIGYDSEVDLRVINNEFWLGHDSAQYQVDEAFLTGLINQLWIHAKNLNALHFLIGSEFNYFWHQEDSYTLTSKHYIWAYPGQPLTSKCVMVMPEWNDPEFKNLDLQCYGICSDFISDIMNQF